MRNVLVAEPLNQSPYLYFEAAATRKGVDRSRAWKQRFTPSGISNEGTGTGPPHRHRARRGRAALLATGGDRSRQGGSLHRRGRGRRRTHRPACRPRRRARGLPRLRRRPTLRARRGDRPGVRRRRHRRAAASLRGACQRCDWPGCALGRERGGRRGLLAPSAPDDSRPSNRSRRRPMRGRGLRARLPGARSGACSSASDAPVRGARGVAPRLPRRGCHGVQPPRGPRGVRRRPDGSGGRGRARRRAAGASGPAKRRQLGRARKGCPHRPDRSRRHGHGAAARGRAPRRRPRSRPRSRPRLRVARRAPSRTGRGDSGVRVERTRAELRAVLDAERRQGRTIGLVPTMGYLHEGHMSLLRAARARCDLVVMSLFVNPAQFGPGEDLASYPRDEARDLELAEAAGVDVVFAPPVEEVYPEGFATTVEVEGLTAVLDGAPDQRGRAHFHGVTTVVAKLFNSVEPDVALFGQKDAQQALVIKRMTSDLDFPVEIAVMPTIREDTGLAMSSRNGYLSEEEREQALALSRAL